MASPRSLAALGALFALAACGGGGGTSTPPPPPATSTQAVLSVSLAGGATPGIDHLWVTVTGLAMNADATWVDALKRQLWNVQPSNVVPRLVTSVRSTSVNTQSAKRTAPISSPYQSSSRKLRFSAPVIRTSSMPAP